MAGWGRGGWGGERGRGYEGQQGKGLSRGQVTTHSGNTAPPHRGRPDLLCHRGRAWGGTEAFLDGGSPSPTHLTTPRVAAP